jgi:DNA-binding MarR family transcriptional regulator
MSDNVAAAMPSPSKPRYRPVNMPAKAPPHTRDRRSLDDELLRAAHALENACERAVLPLGVSFAGYRVLFALSQGSEPRTCASLGSALLVPVPDVTRLIDRLVDAHLVTRARDAADRRIASITISPTGEALLARATPLVESISRRAWGHLSASEIATMSDLLASIDA